MTVTRLNGDGICTSERKFDKVRTTGERYSRSEDSDNHTFTTGSHPHRVALLLFLILVVLIFRFAFFFRLTRKRVNVFFHTDLFAYLIFCQLILYVFLDCSFISSNCIYKISSTPEMTISILIF